MEDATAVILGLKRFLQRLASVRATAFPEHASSSTSGDGCSALRRRLFPAEV